MDYDNVFETLMKLGNRHGVRPDVPLESEDFFRDLVSSYAGLNANFSSWLDREISTQFRYILKPPEWLQGPEWPVFQGRPMLFVGQIDLPLGSNDQFHHDASYYVFLDHET